MGQGWMRATAAAVETTLRDDDLAVLTALPQKQAATRAEQSDVEKAAGLNSADVFASLRRLATAKLVTNTTGKTGLLWKRSELGDLIVERALKAKGKGPQILKLGQSVILNEETYDIVAVGKMETEYGAADLVLMSHYPIERTQTGYTKPTLAATPWGTAIIVGGIGNDPNEEPTSEGMPTHG